MSLCLSGLNAWRHHHSAPKQNGREVRGTVDFGGAPVSAAEPAIQPERLCREQKFQARFRNPVSNSRDAARVGHGGQGGGHLFHFPSAGAWAVCGCKKNLAGFVGGKRRGKAEPGCWDVTKKGFE